VQRIFHVGGDVDFDNYFRWMAPWRLLRSGKITVLPAIRRYQSGRWPKIPHECLRPERDQPFTHERLTGLLRQFASDLDRYPLYISLDKDVMIQADSVVNWDSGHLTLGEVKATVEVFAKAVKGALIGMDIVGDWSPVRLRGLLRRFLHWTEHPSLNVEPAEAARRNEQTNLAMLDLVQTCTGGSLRGAA
jgi:hypothetical protein